VGKVLSNTKEKNLELISDRGRLTPDLGGPALI